MFGDIAQDVSLLGYRLTPTISMAEKQNILDTPYEPTE